MKKILIIGSLAALTLTAVGLVATASLGAKEVTPVHLTIRASEMQYEPKELHLKAWRHMQRGAFLLRRECGSLADEARVELSSSQPGEKQ